MYKLESLFGVLANQAKLISSIKSNLYLAEHLQKLTLNYNKQYVYIYLSTTNGVGTKRLYSEIENDFDLCKFVYLLRFKLGIRHDYKILVGPYNLKGNNLSCSEAIDRILTDPYVGSNARFGFALHQELRSLALPNITNSVPLVRFYKQFYESYWGNSFSQKLLSIRESADYSEFLNKINFRLKDSEELKFVKSLTTKLKDLPNEIEKTLINLGVKAFDS